MKNIRIVLVIVLSISFLTINAQEKKIKFNKGTLSICSSRSFIIEGYNGDEVIIESLHNKRSENSISYFPANSKKGTLTSYSTSKSNFKNKKNKKGEWKVVVGAVSGVYSENDNDTLAKPKQIYFNTNSNFKSLGEKYKNDRWVISSGVKNKSYFNTGIDSLSSKEAFFFNSFDIDRKKGLKKLGKKNENKELGIYFIIEQKGDQLVFKDNTESSFIMSAHREQYKIKIPNSLQLNWDTNCSTEKKERKYFFFNSEKSSLSNFDGEVSISNSIQDVKLKDVTGPVTINTIGGNVNIVFDDKTPKKLYSIYSNNGFIDITLPKNSSLKLDATASDIFSDINFELEYEKVVDNLQQMKLKLNSGKVTMKLNAGLGNIYLRKK